MRGRHDDLWQLQGGLRCFSPPLLVDEDGDSAFTGTTSMTAAPSATAAAFTARTPFIMSTDEARSSPA